MAAQVLVSKFMVGEIMDLLDDSLDEDQEAGLYYTHDSEKNQTTISIVVSGDWSPVE